MPSTARTSTKVFVPYFSWRRPSDRTTSSQRSTRCRRTSARAATSQGRRPPGIVRPARDQARTPTARASPRGARTSTSFFTVSRPPALALDRLVSEEEPEGDHAEVEDEVFQVHDSLD